MSCTRRDILKSSLLLPLAPMLQATSIAAGNRSDRDSDRDTVLVVVQLSGGNDGLNTLVPYEDDEYHRNRSTLVLPAAKIHKIGSSLGFHPRMEGFSRLYKDGDLSVIQAVGSAHPDRGHDLAMRVWHTAEPENANCQSGWIGRTVDRIHGRTGADVPAVFVGPIATPFAMNAVRTIVPAITSPQDLIAADHKSAAIKPSSTDNQLLKHLQRSNLRSRANSSRIEAALKADTYEYPSTRLAEDLRTVAQLIRADVGIRIFFVELGGGGIGGFDNHANQLGNHCAVVEQLSKAITAFVGDLKKQKLLDKTLLMTFSEFGRTLAENGRRGTGHGDAAPLFLAGGKLKGGLFGSHPSLTDLDEGALRHSIDFRRVYATALDEWLGIDSKPILGGDFAPLDVFKA